MQLDIRQLGKLYRGKDWGLCDLTLTIGRGVLGLLGPNGAGKSTLMRILATVTQPTTGAVTWNGVDIVQTPDPLRRVLGYLPQSFGVYPHLTAVEFLLYLAAVKGLAGKAAERRVEELLELVNLRDAARRPLGGFSGGMKQRVGVAQALLNDPQVLIVDEPTVGLDPEERVRFRHLLADLSGDRIVLLSTHIVSDIEAVASQIAILDHGRLLVHGSPEELLTAAEGHVWSWTVPSRELEAVRRRFQVSAAVRRSDGVQVRIVGDAPPAGDAHAVPPTLEDAYLRAIQGAAS